MMILIYLPLWVLWTAVGAGWASWVAADRYRHLDRDLRREIIIGLIIIAMFLGPVAVFAAYLSSPMRELAVRQEAGRDSAELIS